MKKTMSLILAVACLLGLFGCQKENPPQAATPTLAATEPTQPATEAPSEGAHQHSFGEWVMQAASSCIVQGREERRCQCGFFESRALPLGNHYLNSQNMCRVCRRLVFDDSATFVELGVICDEWYKNNLTARHVWDLKIWNGKLYRAAGDYDKNSGATSILAYDIANQTWEVTGKVPDEAIHSFVEIGGTLVAPGVDATDSWDYGNYYVLQEDGTWQQVRNISGGIHNFDMIEFDGKIFAGVGTKKPGNTVAMSEDGGNTFQFVPLVTDDIPYPFSRSDWQYSRTYELVEHNGELYALVQLHLEMSVLLAVFRYEDGKMHYVANGHSLFATSLNKKAFGGEIEWNGTCYVNTSSLFAVTDFSDPTTWKKITMPNEEAVRDIFLRDGAIYVLASSTNRNAAQFKESYKTVIYKSTTGEAGSFEEVLSFDYTAAPLSFEYDGEYFYIGTGDSLDTTKTGMVLRAKATK